MSILRNLLGSYVPIRERREISGTLAAINSETVLSLNGDQSVLVVLSSNAFVGTVEFTGQSDQSGSLYFPVPAYPVSPACAGGTILQAAQPILNHALVAANTLIVYSVPVSQLQAFRIRCSAYTSGSLAVSLVSDSTQAFNTLLNGGAVSSTLLVTATAAVGLAITANLPAVPGLRHYIDEVTIIRSATAALTPAAAPVLITTTNLPGAPVLTLGADAGGVGVDKTLELPTGKGGLAASALGVATTIVCPAYAGVVWRINAAYHLGL